MCCELRGGLPYTPMPHYFFNFSLPLALPFHMLEQLGGGAEAKCAHMEIQVVCGIAHAVDMVLGETQLITQF